MTFALSGAAFSLCLPCLEAPNRVGRHTPLDRRAPTSSVHAQRGVDTSRGAPVQTGCPCPDAVAMCALLGAWRYVAVTPTVVLLTSFKGQRLRYKKDEKRKKKIEEKGTRKDDTQQVLHALREEAGSQRVTPSPPTAASIDQQSPASVPAWSPPCRSWRPGGPPRTSA